MNWKELLVGELEGAYKTTMGLMDKVNDSELSWKPSAENNWMSMSQLLMHLTNACGACFKGFVTGDWGMPEDMDISNLKPEDMLPPAEKLPSIASVEEAKRLLAEDKQLALDILNQVSEDDLANKITTAPWNPTEKVLGYQLLMMVEHLQSHKSQLFYYLKLQGKPVHTGDLWSM